MAVQYKCRKLQKCNRVGKVYPAASNSFSETAICLHMLVICQQMLASTVRDDENIVLSVVIRFCYVLAAKAETCCAFGATASRSMCTQNSNKKAALY